MKVWQSYGSEHSMDLVMIGRFKDVNDAEETKEIIDSLFDNLQDKVRIEAPEDRYSDEVLKLLRCKKVTFLAPQELNQFLFDIRVELNGSEIRVTTDEQDVSGIQKIMLNRGAKIEIFSAHDYPESDNDNT